MSFINYAHRGAPAYMPENTFLSFYTGLSMGANGIETDVQITKDGVLVLFHDDTILRVTGKEGSIKDYTFAELQAFDVKNGAFVDKIPAFEDFLKHFAHFDITFAIELKVGGVEREVIDLLGKYNMREKTIITSFRFDYIKAAKEYAPDYRIGWLVKSFDSEGEKALADIGGYEMCPRAGTFTAEDVARWRALGLGVRAWGVKDEALMKEVYALEVDGMTVNFPDKLTAYIK